MPDEFDIDLERGLIRPARQVSSSNCDARPDDAAPQLIVLHGISLPPGVFGGDEIEALFTNSLDWDAHVYFDEVRGLEVSAHLLVRRDGELLQFVPFGQRAWGGFRPKAGGLAVRQLPVGGFHVWQFPAVGEAGTQFFGQVTAKGGPGIVQRTFPQMGIPYCAQPLAQVIISSV